METKSPAAINALVFDIGNVLLRFDFNLALQKLARHGDPSAEIILHLIEPAKAAFEGGRLPRADFQAELRAIVRYIGSDDDLVSAWEDIFTENKPMVQAVEKLHGRFPLYLLSNTSDIHVDFIFRQYPVFRLFKDAVYSYRARASKPEALIYRIAVEQFGIEPSRTLFIDDLAANIDAALAAGFCVHHYHHDRHQDFIDSLAALGVRL